MSDHLIFEPIRTGLGTSKLHGVSLDMSVPRGVYIGSSNSRYLVCDEQAHRYVVVLSHPNLPVFSTYILGTTPFDTVGRWGEGIIHLGDRLHDDTTLAQPGDLIVDDGKLTLETFDGTVCRPTIMYGWTNALPGIYREWCVMSELEDVLFSTCE